MKQKIVLVIIAIVGLGVGLAAGIAITNSKNKAAIAKLQQSEASSKEKIRSYDDIIIQLNNELQLAKFEIQTLKTQVPAPAAEETTAAQTADEKTAAAPADNSIPETANLYTIKSGDSLWSIAQKQLGNGNRVNDILKLNPKISAKSSLVVGAKLKIPAK